MTPRLRPSGDRVQQLAHAPFQTESTAEPIDLALNPVAVHSGCRRERVQRSAIRGQHTDAGLRLVGSQVPTVEPMAMPWEAEGLDGQLRLANYIRHARYHAAAKRQEVVHGR